MRKFWIAAAFAAVAWGALMQSLANADILGHEIVIGQISETAAATYNWGAVHPEGL